MRHLYLTFIIFLLHSVFLFSQSEPIQLWSNFGSKWSDAAFGVIQNMQGEIVVAGKTASISNKGVDVYWAIFNQEGRLLKEKNIGYRKEDVAHAIIQTHDGGYLLAGYTEAEVPGHRGKKDAWLIKIDENGNWLWDQLIGTAYDDAFHDVVQTENGTIIATGHFNQQTCLVHYQPNGEKISQFIYPSQGKESGTALLLSPSQNIVVVGNSLAEKSTKQLFILKTFLNGEKQWKKYFSKKEALDVWEDGGDYFIAGNNLLFGGDKDASLMKVNEKGDSIWTKTYEGRSEDVVNAISQNLGGDFFLTGYSYSYAKGARRPKVYFNQVDRTGKEVLGKAFYFGGAQSDEMLAAIHTDDNGFVMAGYSASNSSLGRDVWLMKLEGETLPKMPTDPKIIVQQEKLMDEDGNGILDAGERGYYVLNVSNESATDAYQIVANVQMTTGVYDIHHFPKIHVGYIKAGTFKKVYLPVRGGENLEKGNNHFEVTWTAQENPILQPLHFDIKSEKKAQPDLKIIAHRFETGNDGIAQKGEALKLIITVANRGTQKAEGVRIKFSLPYKVNAEKNNVEFKLKDIAPNTERAITLNFTAESVYLEEAIEIGCRVTERAYKFGEEKKLVLPLETPLVTISEPKDKTTNSLAVVWLSPNPNELTNPVISYDISEFKIKAKAKSNRPLEKEHFRVMVNGQVGLDAASGSKYEVKKLGDTGDGSSHTYTIESTIQLQEGENYVYVLVNNEAGKDRTSVIQVNHNPLKPDLHILSIGVPADNLQYTMKDAADFAAAFKNQEGLFFHKIHTRLLNTPEATQTQNIREKIEDLVFQDIPENDLVMLFISAHGYYEDDVFRIIASDFDGLHTSYTVHYQNDILSQFKKLKSKSIVFIDACQSGGVKGSKSLYDPRDKEINEAILQYSEAVSGMRVIVSGNAKELSYEDEAWENGAFTEAILAALEGGNVKIGRETFSANGDSNGFLTLKELCVFIEKYVPFLVQKEKKRAQNPVVNPDFVKEEDLPIYFFR